MEIIQIAGYSLAGGLLGYGLPQLGWDLAQRQNGLSDLESTSEQTDPSDASAEDLRGTDLHDLKRPAG